MSNNSNFLLGALVAAGLTLPAVAQDTATAETTKEQAPVEKIDVTADTVVATVNGEEITFAHLLVARASLPAQFQELPDDVLLPGIVEQLIQQAVLSQSGGELSAVSKIQLENQRRELIAAERVTEIISGAVTDEALQAAYDATYANAEPTKEFNASHILVETEDEANVLIDELEAGADFAELAKERSTGPSGPSGGELGWFGPGMMVKPFEDAVLTMEVGSISAPVQTQFGWHVVKLNETRETGAPALEDVRAELAGQIENEAIEAALSELTEAAKIDRISLEGIDPAALRDMSLLEK